MAVKRLGKGLEALIPEMSTDEPKNDQRLIDVEVSQVKPNPFQPRENFDPAALEELKQSINENGVIQPISIRSADNGYELIAGERRLRAVQALGLDRIPAFIMKVESDEEMMEFALIENIQREDLNPVDEANGFQTLMDKCGLTQDEVAKKVGKDRSTVTNSLRLLKLPETIQESLVIGDISSGHARAFLSLAETSDQTALWKQTVRKGLSVRQVEKLVKDQKAGTKGRRKKVKAEAIDPHIRDTEDQLRSVLGTQVKITESRKGESGKIEIEYYSDSEFERLVDLIKELG